MHHKVELIERKDPINQLEASKSSIKDFFIYLLNETRRYQITLKVVLKKNTNSMEKLNLGQFISTQQPKQW